MSPAWEIKADITWAFQLDDLENASLFHGTLNLLHIFDINEGSVRIDFRDTIDNQFHHVIEGSECFMDAEQYQLFMRGLGQRDYSLFVKNEHNNWTEVSFDRPTVLKEFCMDVVTGMIDDPQLALIFNNGYSVPRAANSG